MRFSESNNSKIRLHINNQSFKAYLEDSDITYETKDMQLPFAPVSFTNDSMATRVMEKAKFTFNVYSETRKECIDNYNELQTLIKSIKPSYRYIQEQLAPVASNVTGFVNINFIGMPSGRDNITMHLNSFSYTLDKEIGYIQVPVSDLASNKDAESYSYYDPSGMKLIPLAFKISLDGKILLPFEQTVRMLNKKDAGSGTLEIDKLIKDTVGIDPTYIEQITSLVSKLSGDILTYNSEANIRRTLVLAKELKDNHLVDINTGNFLSDTTNIPAPYSRQSGNERGNNFSRIVGELKDIYSKENQPK